MLPTLLRILACALLVLAPSIVQAQPRRPTAAQTAELARLTSELRHHQSTQATYAAVKVARALYKLQRQASGDDAPETDQRAMVLAGLLSQTADHAGALAMYEHQLAAIERRHGAESRAALNALMPLIGPYWSQNRLDDLEPIQQRVVALTKKLDGEHSLGFARALTQYGTLLSARNQYSSAQRVFEQALAIQEALAPSKDDPSLLGPIQVLASTYWFTNQRPRAIKLYDRAIKLVQAQPGATVQMIAATLGAAASVYHYGGRDDLAAPLTRRVIDLFKGEIARLERDKPDDPMLAGLVGQLGFQYRQQGDLVNATKYISRAVELDAKRTTGFSGWTSTLAELRRAAGQPAEALVLLEQSQAALAKMSPVSAGVYTTMIADVLRELGKFKQAEARLVAYLGQVAKTYGNHHPTYGAVQRSLAYVYMASGRTRDAERLLAASLDNAERELALAMRTGTEADHAVYFARNAFQLDSAVSFQLKFAPTSGAAARLGLTTLLRRKGRVLDAAAASLATIRAKLSAADRRLLDDLATARAQLAQLMVSGPTATGPNDYAKAIIALEDQIQRLEVAVGKKSAAYRAVTQPIELAAVQRLIPKDARLIEFVNFQPSDPTARYQINPPATPRRYAAYVVARTGDPTLIDLGPAAAIDTAIEQFRKAVSDPKNQQVVALGRVLHDLTMGRLTTALGRSRELLIAPDGSLNVVPFAALVDGQQQFLIKKFTFTYLTSGRDLLRLKLRSKAQGGGVMFANPSFDAGGPPAGKTPGAPATRGRRSSDLASLSWPPLPGTGQEADEIEKRLRGLTTYRGEAATETSLKRVHGPKILHLATHGFFLPDEPVAVAAPGTTAPPSAGYENPLLRSGLAFAGANKLVSGADDGILTAMEATGLDLWGTKLVVLSACETGVGKVTNGDGVYGLRRALVIAGAESLVMSLWQVDDLATRDLMSGYYQRLVAGRPRSSALRDIQLELAARPAFAHPFYWASFLPAGDNSPLGN